MFASLPLEDLDLSEDQQDKVRVILDRHRPEIEAAVRETFPKVQAINEQTEIEIKAILTDQQKQRLEQQKQRRRHQRPPPPPGGPWMGGPGDPRGPGGPGDRPAPSVIPTPAPSGP